MIQNKEIMIIFNPISESWIYKLYKQKTMTPKQKAEQLVEAMAFSCRECDYEAKAKQCALIAVDELLEATKRFDYTLGPKPSYNDYWLKVKYQIEKL
jgi:hypothetical protein